MQVWLSIKRCHLKLATVQHITPASTSQQRLPNQQKHPILCLFNMTYICCADVCNLGCSPSSSTPIWGCQDPVDKLSFRLKWDSKVPTEISVCISLIGSGNFTSSRMSELYYTSLSISASNYKAQEVIDTGSLFTNFKFRYKFCHILLCFTVFFLLVSLLN